MRTDKADWSTINFEELAKLPVSDWQRRGYQLQDDSGNGCAGDPPGFPTYFTRSVYNSQGNDPSSGYSMVIVHPETGVAYGIQPVDWGKWGVKSWEEFKAKSDALMMRLWKPLPLEHPRVQAWIRATFAHHNHCYQVPELRAQGLNWSAAMLIWPGGCLGNTPYGTLRDPAWEIKQATKNRDYDRWTDAHKAAFLKEIEQANAHIKAACDVVAIPDNHDGTIIVRRFYPEFQPLLYLIEGKFERPGNWWETLATNPKPSECPGQYGHAHPVNGSWCQFCGWHEEKAAA